MRKTACEGLKSSDVRDLPSHGDARRCRRRRHGSPRRADARRRLHHFPVRAACADCRDAATSADLATSRVVAADRWRCARGTLAGGLGDAVAADDGTTSGGRCDLCDCDCGRRGLVTWHSDVARASGSAGESDRARSSSGVADLDSATSADVRASCRCGGWGGRQVRRRRGGTADDGRDAELNVPLL